MAYKRGRLTLFCPRPQIIRTHWLRSRSIRSKQYISDAILKNSFLWGRMCEAHVFLFNIGCVKPRFFLNVKCVKAQAFTCHITPYLIHSLREVTFIHCHYITSVSHRWQLFSWTFQFSHFTKWVKGRHMMWSCRQIFKSWSRQTIDLSRVA